MSPQSTAFRDLNALANFLRKTLANKKFIILFAYNGTGKTRLSCEFKDMGKRKTGEEKTANTLYYNAFTEDLFVWDNDLENDTQRVLKLNKDSRFFKGLESLEMESRIRVFLGRYADFDFSINYETWTVSFSREIRNKDKTETIDHIKV